MRRVACVLHFKTTAACETQRPGRCPGHLPSCWKPVPPRPQSWNVDALADKLLLNGGRPRPVLNWMQLNLGLALYFPLSGFKLAKLKCSLDDLVDVHLSGSAFIVRLHNVFRDGTETSAVSACFRRKRTEMERVFGSIRFRAGSCWRGTRRCCEPSRGD